MAKKAQGLPLNLIVLAAIAALILVLVIAFTIGGAGTFFKQIFNRGITAVGDDVDGAKTNCQNWCTQAQQLTTTAAWKASSYCTKTANIDVNKDGAIKNTPTQNELKLKCKESPISISCSTVIGDTDVSETTCI